MCLDGTWNDGINSDNPLTNVARFARCLKAGDYDDDTRVQIVQNAFYMTGIGTGTSWRANIKEAIYGRGELYERTSASIMDDGSRRLDPQC